MMRFLLILCMMCSPAIGEEERIEQPLRVEISPGQFAQITWQEEEALISGPAEATHSFEAHGLEYILPKYDILRHDIDGDGVREILLPSGIGYGGVNVFYIVLFWRNGEWWSSPEIANPQYSGQHKGLLVSAKSGPTYYRERWDIDRAGHLYLHTSQLATFEGFDVRRVTPRDDGKESLALVYETLSLFDAPTAVWGIVEEDDLVLSAAPDSDEPVARLRAGMGVELLEFDERHWKVLIKASTGETGWTYAESLIVDP